MTQRLDSFRRKSAWRGDFFAVAAASGPLPVPVPDGIKECAPGPSFPFCYTDVPPRPAPVPKSASPRLEPSGSSEPRQ